MSEQSTSQQHIDLKEANEHHTIGTIDTLIDTDEVNFPYLYDTYYVILILMLNFCLEYVR